MHNALLSAAAFAKAVSAELVIGRASVLMRAKGLSIPLRHHPEQAGRVPLASQRGDAGESRDRLSAPHRRRIAQVRSQISSRSRRDRCATNK
jgi:hypothetical protein